MFIKYKLLICCSLTFLGVFVPRPFSGRSQSLGSSRPVIPVPPKPDTPYEIPHFDFDQPEIVEGPPDVDEVSISQIPLWNEKGK